MAERKQIVLYDIKIINEMKDLSLPAARTMHHSVDFRPHGLEYFLNNGRVGTCRGENELTYICIKVIDRVSKLKSAGIEKIVWKG